MSARTRRTTMLRVLLIWLAGVLVIGLAGPAAAAKSDQARGPSGGTLATNIVFTNVSTPEHRPPLGAPGAVGLWYVVQDKPFEAELSFRNDSDSPAPLSTNKSVTVSVSYDGTVLGTHEVQPNEMAATVALTAVAEPAANITLTASADTKPRAVTGVSLQFDVLIESHPITGARSTIGGSGGTPTECNATPDEPVCADLLAPIDGAFDEGGLFSRGVCLTTDTTCRNSYIQALATITGVSASNPATLIMKCDKTLCEGGAIKSKQLFVTLAPGSGDVTAPACEAKGVVNDGATFCVDYVQSTRDNAGDTFLYLLFTEDAKVRFP